MDSQVRQKWEDAFLQFACDASVGRLFRGIIHNLNGVGQAFSMQTELLHMMFAQADDILAKISVAKDLGEAQDQSARLRELLGRRTELAKHLTGEVKILQETMGRVSALAEQTRSAIGADVFKLDTVIATEIEFLNSDGFFKHKIRKELLLADNVPDIEGGLVKIHHVLAILLENAAQALADNMANESSPRITIATSSNGLMAELRVTDNGPGLGSADFARIFEPFYTTRQNHLGMGLYLARAMAISSGGTLSCESAPGQTSFVLKIPIRGGRG